MGVRVALGASRRDILLMIVGRAMKLSTVGAVIGVAVSYPAGQWARTILAGMDPADVVTLAAAVGLAIAMTLAGSLAPAIRASRTNPTVAMRAE
jgi:ABC-type antimicrobial peptide transport system permease subunit